MQLIVSVQMCGGSYIYLCNSNVVNEKNYIEIIYPQKPRNKIRGCVYLLFL